MKIENVPYPVASVVIDQAELKVLRYRSSECGRDLRSYLVQGVECALDFALMVEKDRKEVDRDLAREKERKEYHEARLAYDKAMRSNPGGRKYGAGEKRDHWGNLKKDLPVVKGLER